MNNLRTQVGSKVREISKVTYENQKCPNTFVEVEALGFVSVGYAKVSWPDSWDEDFGFELAFSKAVYDITRQILKSDEAEKYLKTLGVE